jgi:hypothetical protein
VNRPEFYGPKYRDIPTDTVCSSALNRAFVLLKLAFVVVPLPPGPGGVMKLCTLVDGRSSDLLKNFV